MTISELYLLYLQRPTVTTDSRTCPSGSIFFALKGESFDGNTFAEKALLSGCAYAVVDDASVVKGNRMILVDDVLSTLQQIAYTHRKALGIPVIGITGTNGKTTTKELTAAILSQKYNALYTLGNFNNHIGVPLTLLRLTNEHEIAVIEMGANHPGEISELANIAYPDYGLITNVGYAHLEGFGSFEGVIKTKGELYDFLRKTNGSIFINQENEYLAGIAGNLKKITYGEIASVKNPAPVNNPGPFIGGKTYRRHPFFSFQWQQQGKAIQNVSTNLIGDYNLWNALAAIAIGVYFGVSPEQINKAIETYEPTNNRSQRKITKHNELIIDTYNANPSSMRVALENFAAMKSSPKAVILGDMRELGEKSPELHADIVKQIECDGFDKVLLCGEQFSGTGQKYTCFPSVEKLNEYLENNPLQGYHILIKGSRGIHLEKTIDKL
ncbi:MAG: UDP-N-acetylmuramoyl-tripeptide--D-alanyl-D-alanine ligase [Tannerella sp.]|jgi:UDP-N-acetylmuramoyl-tripeptide--D-alanyl-D-alanine ligase|nr:UDP-N-acetylmuramoyl-tripeptide--D-alanyl-D-alanine ligase [Tannerella sp.]